MAGCGSKLADAGTDLPGCRWWADRRGDPGTRPVAGRGHRQTPPVDGAHAHGHLGARYLHTMHTTPTVVGCRPTRHAADCER
jgi:hypothetical protein